MTDAKQTSDPLTALKELWLAGEWFRNHDKDQTNYNKLCAALDTARLIVAKN